MREHQKRELYKKILHYTSDLIPTPALSRIPNKPSLDTRIATSESQLR